jgi:formate C-acetyltransferase
LNCSGAATLNLAKAVERVLAGVDHPSFEALMTAYLGILDSDFASIADCVRRWERLWPRISPTPLLSGTMDSCLERDADISAAGAQYNTSGCCCIGLADAVDSLAAVNQLVYLEQHCALADLRTALAANWEGFEELRLLGRNRVPKWGNNDERVDRLAVAVAGFLANRINREPNARGGVFQAALFGILPIVQQFGKHTGALPNGRYAGEPLTINTGAATGMDRGGVTSLINSVTRIDLTQFPNGSVLDIMLHPSIGGGASGSRTIAALIRSHFAQGGMAIQFNILDAETLRDAKRHPEKYANLQVRVCGWNVRFADLTPTEQDLFIAKAEVA